MKINRDLNNLERYNINMRQYKMIHPVGSKPSKEYLTDFFQRVGKFYSPLHGEEKWNRFVKNQEKDNYALDKEDNMSAAFHYAFIQTFDSVRTWILDSEWAKSGLLLDEDINKLMALAYGNIVVNLMTKNRLKIKYVLPHIKWLLNWYIEVKTAKDEIEAIEESLRHLYWLSKASKDKVMNSKVIDLSNDKLKIDFLYDIFK